MSLSAKNLAVGIVIGLAVGVIIGYFLSVGTLARLYDALSEQEAYINGLKDEIYSKNVEISDLQSQINEKNDQIWNLQSQILTRDLEISGLESQIETKNTQITSLEVQLTENEDEITSLRNQIEELEDIVPPYAKGEWNLIAVFTGSTDKTTELFQVPSSEIRISWELQPGEYATFSIWMERHMEAWFDAWTGLEAQSEGETYAHGLPVGQYFLDLTAYSVQYTVTVEAWIQE